MLGVHVHERDGGIDGGRGHAGNRTHATEQIAQEEACGSPPWDSAWRDGQAHGQRAVGSKGIGTLSTGNERPHHEPASISSASERATSVTTKR